MTPILLPLYGSPVAAGFPSPTDDFLEGYLDLNAYLVKHPAATYFVRAKADAMQGAGIFKGDLMVVDIPATQHQPSLLDGADSLRTQALMHTLDKLDARYGKAFVRLGSLGTKQGWGMKRDSLSRAYTTRWDELVGVR